MSDTLHQQQSGMSAFFMETLLPSIRNRTIGDTSSERQPWELVFSNVGKISATVVGETLAVHHFKKYGVEGIKNIHPDFYKAVDAAVTLDYKKLQLSALDKHYGNLLAKGKVDDVLTETYQRWSQSITTQIDQLQDVLQDIANHQDLNINVRQQGSTTVLDGMVGEGYGKTLFEKLGKVFDGYTFYKVIDDYFNKDLTDETDAVSYLNDVASALSAPFTGDFISGRVGYGGGGRFLDFKYLDDVIGKTMPTLTAKNLAGMAARGVIVGIALDVTYHISYHSAKLLFEKGFEKLFGESLYEMEGFISFMDEWLPIIAPQITIDRNNNAADTNAFLISRFLTQAVRNHEGKPLSDEEIGGLLMGKDEKSIDYDRATSLFQKIYALLSGKTPPENISESHYVLSAFLSTPHVMEVFAADDGRKLIMIDENTDFSTLLTKSLEPDAVAYRYALKNLNDFVLLDDRIYNADHLGEAAYDGLMLYDAQNHASHAGMTAEYLQMRMLMIETLLKQENNIFFINSTGYGFKDLQTGKIVDNVTQELSPGNNIPYPNVRLPQIIFGSDEGEEISVDGDYGNKQDAIFAGTGDDTLDGQAGNDYYEGGTGHDAYHIQDNDTIVDTDGQGKLLFADGNGTLQAQRFMAVSPDAQVWKSVDVVDNTFDNRFRAWREGDDLHIMRLNADGMDSADQASIRHYFLQEKALGKGKMLGIELLDYQDPGSVPGNAQTLEMHANERYHNIFNLQDDSYILYGGSRHDTVFAQGAQTGASGHALRSNLGAGDDVAFGSRYADIVFGGEGTDLLNGSNYMRGADGRSDQTTPALAA